MEEEETLEGVEEEAEEERRLGGMEGAAVGIIGKSLTIPQAFGAVTCKTVEEIPCSFFQALRRATRVGSNIEIFEVMLSVRQSLVKGE